MPPFDNNLEPEEPDQFLPQQPQELPPVPEQQSALATGQDQGAGQAVHQGHDAQPPAFRSPEAIPPTTETSTPFSLDPPATVHYSGFIPKPSASAPTTPPAPTELPPVPRVRNPGRERRKRMRAAKRKASMGVHASDGELLALAGAKEWNAKTTDINEEMGNMWEKAARILSIQQSQLGMVLAILEDTRARTLELERALASYTLPGAMPRGF